ncbi:MAG TPA: hypothetical protein VN258_08385 [Mobilitalea sp.]|nr:hypothetical protein [Mobilitalea sp.]
MSNIELRLEIERKWRDECSLNCKSLKGSIRRKYSVWDGYGAILLFGVPEYYPRFGFVEAKEFGVTDFRGYYFPAFMAMKLKKNYLKDVTGKFYEAPIYDDDLNREQAKAFDDQFCQLLK